MASLVIGGVNQVCEKTHNIFVRGILSAFAPLIPIPPFSFVNTPVLMIVALCVFLIPSVLRNNDSGKLDWKKAAGSTAVIYLVSAIMIYIMIFALGCKTAKTVSNDPVLMAAATALV